MPSRCPTATTREWVLRSCQACSSLRWRLGVRIRLSRCSPEGETSASGAWDDIGHANLGRLRGVGYEELRPLCPGPCSGHRAGCPSRPHPDPLVRLSIRRPNDQGSLVRVARPVGDAGSAALRRDVDPMALEARHGPSRSMARTAMETDQPSGPEASVGWECLAAPTRAMVPSRARAPVPPAQYMTGGIVRD
jgi:hypothetical protein